MKLIWCHYVMWHFGIFELIGDNKTIIGTCKTKTRHSVSIVLITYDISYQRKYLYRYSNARCSVSQFTILSITLTEAIYNDWLIIPCRYHFGYVTPTEIRNTSSSFLPRSIELYRLNTWRANHQFSLLRYLFISVT